MIKVNGEYFDYDKIALLDFLKENGYNIKTIAVECNEEIIPKSDFDGFILKSGDVIEIVSFVGGG